MSLTYKELLELQKKAKKLVKQRQKMMLQTQDDWSKDMLSLIKFPMEPSTCADMHTVVRCFDVLKKRIDELKKKVKA